MIHSKTLISFLLTTLLSCTTIHSLCNFDNKYLDAHYRYSYEDKKSWPTLAKKYMGSFFAGFTVGSLSALGCAYLEDAELFPFVWPITWIIFRSIRNRLTNSICYDARQYNIDHDQETIHNSAWIFDWIIYLYYKAVLKEPRIDIKFSIK